MRAGRLCHRIELQRSTDTIVNGDVVKSWTMLATVWAEVSPLIGREFFAARQTQAEITHKINLRYIPGVTLTPADRVKFGTRTFDIVSVLNVGERNRELVIQAIEHL